MDNNTEKECFSNTLKIEFNEVTVPTDKSAQAIVVRNDEEIVEENSEKIVTNEESESDVDDPAVELVNEHVVVNSGGINKSADIPAVENDIELDVRPDTYHDHLRAEIGRLLLVNCYYYLRHASFMPQLFIIRESINMR